MPSKFCLLILLISSVQFLPAGSSRDLPVRTQNREVHLVGATAGGVADITYFGAGGISVEYSGNTFLGAPFLSNPSVFKVLFLPIKPDEDRINSGYSHPNNLRVILVGHAHYDHLLDIPFLYERYEITAPIVGSRTAKNILAAAPKIPPDLVYDAGEGYPNTLKFDGIEVIPIESTHAPHLPGIKFFCGKVHSPRTRLPRTAWGWKEGQTYAYLLKMTNSDRPDQSLLVYYQDAAATDPATFIKNSEYADVQIDIAILCVPGFNLINSYPEAIIREINPRHVVLIHWENFFKPLPSQPKNLRAVPLCNVNRFIRRTQDVLDSKAGLTLPAPGVQIRCHLD